MEGSASTYLAIAIVIVAVGLLTFSYTTTGLFVAGIEEQGNNGVATMAVNTTEAGKVTMISQAWNSSVSFTDAGYIFSTNSTGVWANSSFTTMPANNLTSWNFTLNNTPGTAVGVVFYVNDSAGIWNSSNWTGSVNTIHTIAPNSFDFNVTIKFQNETLGNNVNVTITEYLMGQGGPPTAVRTVSNTTADVNGVVWLKNISNASAALYGLDIKRNITGMVTHIMGSNMPSFMPAMFYQNGFNGETLYLDPAIILNLSVVNDTDAFVKSDFDVLDAEFGDYVKSSNQQGTVFNLITLSRSRNYTINVYPNNSAPMSFQHTNSTSYDAGSIINTSLNGSMRMITLNGTVLLNESSAGPLDYFNGTNFNVQAGRIFMQAAFSNIGLFGGPGGGSVDSYNTSTGQLNVSAPAVSTGFQVLLVLLARNNSVYYAGFQNTTVNLSSNATVNLGTINMTTMHGANSTFWNITTFSAGTLNFSTALTVFNVTQSEGSAQGMFGEFNITYPNGLSYKWNGDASGGLFYFPLPVNSSVTAQFFASGAAPVKYKFNTAKLATAHQFNITTGSFEGKSGNGTDFKDNFLVKMFNYQNSSCNVAIPPTSCLLFTFGNFTEDMEGAMRNGMKLMLLGKASPKMTDIATGVSVHYIGVDMRSAGAPPASMDTSANESTTSGSSLDQVWRFGSTGPDTYDYVYVSVPYSESTLNESGQVNITIDKLFDTNTFGTDWITVWDRDDYANLTAAYEAAAVLTDYAARFSEWQYLINGTTCHTNETGVNTTHPCYINTTNNYMIIRIPHFSGAAPKVTGSAIVAASSSSSSSSSGGGGGGGGGGSTNPTKSRYYSALSIGDAIQLDVNRTTINVTNITAVSGSSASGVRVIATQYITKPVAITVDPPGTTYGWIEINLTSLSTVASANVRFKVDKTWVTSNNLDSSKVKLHRYVSGSWQALETTLESEDSIRYYYSAETPGFSYFAIAGEAAQPEPVCTSGSLRCSENTLQECVSNSWTTNQSCQFGCTAGACNPEPAVEQPTAPTTPSGGAQPAPTNPNYMPIALVVVLVIAVVAFLIFRFRS